MPLWLPASWRYRSGARSIPDRCSTRQHLVRHRRGSPWRLDGLIQPGDRILNPQAWGSWFEFAVPEATVAIDSRIELFPTQVWDDYVRISAGIEGWESILDRWGVTVAVVAAAEPGLRDRLIAAGWTETYVDTDGSVLQPNGLGPSGSGSTASALLESAR